MKVKNAGFINLLFEQSQSKNKRQKSSFQNIQAQRIQHFVEENVFMPRNRLRNLRVIKINQSISTNTDSHEVANHIKKMLLQDCFPLKISTDRQLVSQRLRRAKQKNKMYSPQFNKGKSQNKKNQNQSQSFWQAKDFIDNNSTKKQEQNNQEQFTSILIQDKSNSIALESSTNSSSNKNLIRGGTSVRYRKVVSHDQKNRSIDFSVRHNNQKLNKAKEVLEKKKNIVKFYSNYFANPQNISAKVYLITQHINKKVEKKSNIMHTALNSKINVEIASLTKIMTCILTIQICQKYKIDMNRQTIEIGSFETKVEGTSANIQKGQTYTVNQLLYGLMLPSGNDASIALAIFCGKVIEDNKINSKDRQNLEKKQYYKKFILEMNRKSLFLGMKKTFFSNSHGLANILNKSCASDVSLMIDHALRHDLFRKIVSTKSFECKKDFKRVKWQNTHRFLHTKSHIYKGIKTGITDPAGPCLASLVQAGSRQFTIIVLNSASCKRRYKDTELLRKWLFQKEKIGQYQV